MEIYTPGIGWSPEYAAGWTPPLYPRMHLLPDGTVLYSGSGTGSRIFNPSTKTWTGSLPSTNYAGTRTYGTSVLLPLTPANGYTPRVMIFGGGNPATTTTETLDLSASPLQWQSGPPMSQPRIEMNATILPNGKVLAVGGSDERRGCRNREPERRSLRSDTNTFASAGANAYPRLYHSGSLLLPDATVLLVGGNPAAGRYEAAHGDLLAGVPFQRRRHRGAAARRSPVSHPARSAMAAPFTSRRRTRPTSDRSCSFGRVPDPRVRHGSAAGELSYTAGAAS